MKMLVNNYNSKYRDVTIYFTRMCDLLNTYLSTIVSFVNHLIFLVYSLIYMLTFSYLNKIVYNALSI